MPLHKARVEAAGVAMVIATELIPAVVARLDRDVSLEAEMAEAAQPFVDWEWSEGVLATDVDEVFSWWTDGGTRPDPFSAVMHDHADAVAWRARRKHEELIRRGWEGETISEEEERSVSRCDAAARAVDLLVTVWQVSSGHRDARPYDRNLRRALAGMEDADLTIVPGTARLILQRLKAGDSLNTARRIIAAATSP